MNKIVMLCCLLLITSCTKFLGAQKYSSHTYYTERWFSNPNYLEEIPEGIVFYGEAAEKIKYRFIIKYYFEDGDGNTIEIPKGHIWKVRPGKTDKRELWYENIFLYRNINGKYSNPQRVRVGTKIPVQSCSSDSWCKTYVSAIGVRTDEFEKYDIDNVLYIKKEHLYQGKTILSEKEKQEFLRDNIQAVQAIAPFITPSHEFCKKYGGEITEQNVCYAKWKDAKQICKESGGRLPLIEELWDVVIQCGGIPNDRSNRDIPQYESCYREKGFTHSGGYYSSKVVKKYKDIASIYFNSGVEGLEFVTYPAAVMCIE